MLGDQAQGATHLGPVGPVGPDQFRRSAATDEIDLHLAIPEHMHMRRQVIVEIDDDAQSVGAEHGDNGR